MVRMLAAAVLLCLGSVLPLSAGLATAAPETWTAFNVEADAKGAIVALCTGPAVRLSVRIESVEGPAHGQFVDAFGVNTKSWELTPGFAKTSGLTLVASHFQVFAESTTTRLSGKYGCES